MYDINYFIEKFELIPEDSFTKYQYNNLEENKFCALGHCGTRLWEPSKEGCALSNLLSENLVFNVAHVNDGNDIRYPQPTPKQRILAALYDIRDKELSEANVTEANKLVNTELVS